MLTDRQIAVLKACDGPGLTIAEAAKALGMDAEKVGATMRRLAEKRLLDSMRDNRMRASKLGGSPIIYWTTKAGIEAVKAGGAS